MIVSHPQLETEAETAAERLLEEVDANQDADDGSELCGNQIYVEMSVPYGSTEPARPRHRRDTPVDFHTGDDDGEEQGALESAVAAGVVARRRGGGGPRGARPGFALGAAEEATIDEDAVSDDEEADEVDPDFDPDDDVTMRDPEPTSRKRKAPPAPRPKRRRKTKAAPVEPVLWEYELGRRAKIKRNNKFLVSVGLLFPPKEALEDDEHPWWYMTAR